jgi:hypothetical protein
MFGHYDMILGMNARKRHLILRLQSLILLLFPLRRIVRNFYTLFDYGNFIEDTSNDRGDPYVQLLSLTNPITARADFVQARLNGVDTTNSSSETLLPASQESHSPISAAEKKQHLEGLVARHWPYIFVGCLAFVLCVTGCCIYACCCSKRRKGRKGVQAFGKNPYQAIHDPAPPVHMRRINSNTGA